MATVLGLTMKIAANTAGIAQGAKQTAKQLEGIQKSATAAASAMRTMVAIKVGEILAKGFSAAYSSVSSFVTSIRQSVDATAKLAAQTGIAVEALQGFQIAASMSGVDNLVEPIRKLGIEIGRAAETGQTDKFEKLGLNFAELSRMAPEDQFKAIAAAISSLGTPAERAAAAVAIFGEQGVKMLPLFESNLEAVQARLERLGIVLSGDQTAAIEEMNDALLLVYKTFEGIISQVTANLAPVVTDLAEMFLQMVEGYEGVNGTGGTAIADSITDALFDGAEYLAGILDWAVAAFNEFGVGLETASAVFEFVANTFVAVAETLRGIFNVFEMIGNAILLGLGKVLEGIGSWVSSDLEQAGKDISAAAYDGMVQNGKEAGDAFAHAANAALGDRNYGRESGGGGDGMFSSAVGGARERYQNRNSPEAQAAREAKRREEQEARDAAQREAERARKAEEEAKRQAEAQKKYDEQVAKARDELASKEFQYAMKNAEDLAAVNQKALKATDIRSGGIDQVLAMATGREDPAVAEARKQLRELQVMRASLQALEATPVEITGAA